VALEHHRTQSGLFCRNWFWLLGAPFVVVVGLLMGRNVFVVFAVYHLGFCLILPAVNNILRRCFTLSDHLDFLGLTGPGTTRGLVLGFGLGVILAGGIILIFHLFGEIFLAGHDVPEVLARWGAGKGNISLLFWFMTLVNGPAEELYWRGFVHTEMSDRRPRLATILLIAACYASYHGVTVYVLAASLPVALLFMAAIFVAGWGWGWLREKTGSVWPALLGHTGAAAAYMIVARPLMDL
jgi:membrane protease YdiL (CAAX protease family)